MNRFTGPESQLSDLTVGMMQRYAANGNVLDSLSWCLPQILNQIDAQAGSLFLIQPNLQDLSCVVCEGPVDIKGVTVPISAGLVGQVFHERAGLLIEDAQTSQAHNHAIDQKTGFVTKSILTVPVLFGDKCFGCLQAINRVDDEGAICSFGQAHLHVFEKLAAVLAVALQNVDLATELVKDALLKKDLKSAEDAQTNLFPGLGAFDTVVGQVIPARNLSGDFVDYLQVNDRILFCQGDVSGKGIPAALTVARCLALFRYFAKLGLSPAQLAQVLNTEIYEMSSRLEKSAGFVTFFVGSFSQQTFNLEFVNCGHGDVLVYDSSGNVQIHGSGCPPIGIMETDSLAVKTEWISLKDRRLYVFTDGVSEARLGESEIGLSGVSALIKALAGLPIEQCLEKFMSLFKTGKLVTSDDATLMIVGQ
jgi:sigma-B regulation protein RsbU (phosphoserine phosphatase)